MRRTIGTFIGSNSCLVALLFACASVRADEGTMSSNREIMVVPAPGTVTIDGKTDDWDLSAGIWSYNSPTVVEKYGVWTHLMWDDKGVYMLARYNDSSPMQNAARGKDFQQSWRADAYQARVIFDDKTPDEHILHVNMFYSSQEYQPYMIVKHGGFKDKAPFDGTGPNRPDQLEKYGADMLAKGGKIAFQKWEDGRGYNMEVFWPWSYLRTSGQPLKPGDNFVYGIEAMWGNGDGTSIIQRLADGIKDEKTNRIFMFRARDGWGRAILTDKGHLDVEKEQIALQQRRLKQYENYDTVGSVPINYEIKQDGDVTIAIDDAQGQRVRNLFGQYPRKAGSIKDLWDGLDDRGKPVAPGAYTATVVDHKPVELKLFNSVYSSATPPWVTETGAKLWGANHGHPTSVTTRGDIILCAFTGTEGGSGIQRITPEGKILWTDGNEFVDVALDDNFAYGLSRSSWQKKTLLIRYRLTDGQIMPFEDEAKSPAFMLLPTDQGTSNESSIAAVEGKLVVCIPGQPLFVLDPKTGATEGRPEIPNLAAVKARDDKLVVLLNDGTVARSDLAGKLQVIFKADGLKKPVRLGVRQDAQEFAISDDGTNQVFVYDAGGKHVRAIGKAYEGSDRPAGKFVETDFIEPLGLDFDAQGRLWVSEANKFCKRVTCWSGEGQLVDQYWGQADYGAMAGFAITNDSTRFIAHAVEFKLDPHPDVLHTKSNEKPLLFHPELKDERGFVYTLNGHDYATGAPGYNKPDSLMIAKRDKDGVFHPVVRIDQAGRKMVNGKWVVLPSRAWTDLNDDGKQDANEMVDNVPVVNMYWSNGWVRPDLTILSTNSNVFPVKGFTKEGVPLYDFANPVRPANALKFDDKQGAGSTPVMDMAGNLSNGITYATVDGRRGSYPNLYGRHDAPAARRGVLIAPFRTNGVVENVPGVGSITAIGGDRGQWFLMSMDGLYLSSILQDSKGEVTLDDTYVGQESFGGFIWRDEKDRVLVQLGGPSYRLMEVKNLETTHKQQIKVDVSAGQLVEGQRLATAAKSAGDAEPTELTIAKVDKLPTEAVSPETSKTDELISGAQTFRVQESGNPSRWFRAALAHDGKNLALMYQVNDSSPWKNAAGLFTHAFIGGDCVDLKLDVAGRGPERLLVAPVGGKDTVVFFQKKSDEKDNPTKYSVGTNVGNTETNDIVRRSKGAKVVKQVGMSGYTVLVTVPLAELGLDSVKEAKGVVGVIYSDPSGTNRQARMYWSDKNTDLVSDVPSEARIDPTRFGKISIGQ